MDVIYKICSLIYIYIYVDDISLVVKWMSQPPSTSHPALISLPGAILAIVLGGSLPGPRVRRLNLGAGDWR